jgi:hypothetical protein
MMKQALSYRSVNGFGPQFFGNLLLTDIAECNDLYKRVLVKPLKRFSESYVSTASRAKTTAENPNRAMRRLAREMHKAGYQLADFMLLVTDIECVARSLWGRPCITRAAIVEASRSEQEAECRENVLQLALHGDATKYEIRAARDAHLESIAREQALVEILNAALGEQ